MKREKFFRFDGEGTCAIVSIYRNELPILDGSPLRRISVWLYLGEEAIFTVDYRLHELDMALALAEYYARKVKPNALVENLFEDYPLLRLYSHRNAYSKRQQQKLGSRWKEVKYSLATPYGLQPLWRR